MAKKKKGNMRNIQSGDTVQFLNYLTPDHILRGKYNTGNNELDITDVPANLNSVITLGQGGGGGGTDILIRSFVTTTSYGDNYKGSIGAVVIDEEGAEVFKDLPEIKLTIAEAGLTDYVLQSNGDPDEVVFGDSGFSDIDFFVVYDTDRRVLDLYSLAELNYKVVTIKK